MAFPYLLLLPSKFFFRKWKKVPLPLCKPFLSTPIASSIYPGSPPWLIFLSSSFCEASSLHFLPSQQKHMYPTKKTTKPNQTKTHPPRPPNPQTGTRAWVLQIFSWAGYWGCKYSGLPTLYPQPFLPSLAIPWAFLYPAVYMVPFPFPFPFPSFLFDLLLLSSFHPCQLTGWSGTQRTV